MKRLVYTPKVSAYVKSDYGVIDLSPYITAGSVNRKLDQISSAEITIRNPGKKWTEHRYTDSITKQLMVGPIFHPMDPITIVMTRLQNRPIQVFTGFLDQSPYLQLHPGTVTLQSSCTLKKFLYTFYDAGLPFFNEFLSQYGWRVQPGLGIVNSKAEEGKAKEKGHLTEANFGNLLYGVVHQIGGWDDESIFIEELPKHLLEIASELLEGASEEVKKSNEELKEVFHEIIGEASLGSGGLAKPVGHSGGAGPASESVVSAVDVGRAMLTAGFPSERTVLAQGMAVVSVESNFGKFAPMCWEPNEADCCGYWQIQLTHPGATVAKTNNLVEASELALSLWKACGGSFSCDWYSFEAGASSTAEAYQPYLSTADTAIKMGPFTAQSGETKHHPKFS